MVGIPQLISPEFIKNRLLCSCDYIKINRFDPQTPQLSINFVRLSPKNSQSLFGVIKIQLNSLTVTVDQDGMSH